MLNKTLLELLNIYSPSGHERPVVEYIVNYCKDIGLEVQLDEKHNIFIRLEGKGEPIMLTGHTDTVTNGTKPRAVEKDGVITSENDAIAGLDDKASVALMLETLKYFANGTRPYRTIEVVMPVAEELGCIGSAHIQDKKPFDFKSKEGICFDLPKPFGTILHGAAGLWRGTLAFKGVTSHSARPEQGNDALHAATQFTNEFLQRRHDDGVRMNVGHLEAGYKDAYNIVPDNAYLQIDLRSLNDLDAEIRAMKKMIKEHTERNGVSIEIKEELTEIPDYSHKENDMWIKEVEQKMKEHGAEIIHEPFSYGCSDANRFHKLGINVLVIGNEVEDTHNVKEKVEVAKLEKVFEFTKDIIAL